MPPARTISRPSTRGRSRTITVCLVISDHELTESREETMRIGIAADHAGFALKSQLILALETAGCEMLDFGSHSFAFQDDYPDFVVPLARAVASGQVLRGIAICGNGVGACVAANKVDGVRAALITECFSAHQGVEEDDMNLMCLGSSVTGTSLSWDLVKTFLSAHFEGDEHFRRRIAKVMALE